jgi:hypothetical protein
MITFDRNQRSRCTGLGDHLPPESVITFDRNTQVDDAEAVHQPRLQALAPGLTPRSVLEKFAAVQMIDVHLPTTDGRELVLTRYTEPEPELSLLLEKLKLELPAQPPPKITAVPAPPTPL